MPCEASDTTRIEMRIRKMLFIEMMNLSFEFGVGKWSRLVTTWIVFGRFATDSEKEDYKYECDG